MIQIGQKLFAQKLKGVGTQGVEDIDVESFFAGQRVVVFGLPGAFTPVCSKTQVPGFVEKHKDFAARGIARVVCVATNDPAVLQAWKENLGVGTEVYFLSDGNNTWLSAMGLTFDASKFSMGERSKRFAMVVDDGVVQHLSIESNAGVCGVSSSDAVLKFLAS